MLVRLRPLLALLCAAAFTGLPAARAAEHAIGLPHFGRLLDNNDAPVSGVRKITFRIYDAGAVSATEIWKGVYDVDLSAEGTYAVTLGDATHPFDVATVAAGDRWLGVQVEAAPEFSPRQQFGSVLFALRALEAKNVKGGTVDGVQITNSTLEAPTITGGTLSNVVVDATSLTTASATITGGTLSGVAVEATTLKAGSIEIAGQPVGANGVAKAGDTMSGPLVAPKFVSNAAAGAPLEVQSRELVANLNAELLGGTVVADLQLRDDLPALTNLAHNGAFENFLRGAAAAPNWWSVQGTFAANSGVSRVTGYTGEYAVQLNDLDAEARVVIRQLVYVKAGPGLAGRTFTAATAFRLASGAARGQLCIADAGPVGAETSKTCAELTGTADWSRAAVSHVVGAAPAYLAITLSSTVAIADLASYQFDELALVEGRRVAPYSPNAEDGLAGSVSAFAQACPTGWNEYTAARGRFLRGEPAGNAAALDQGGSDDAVVVAHTHGVVGNSVGAGSHTHGVSGNTANAGDHAHAVDPPNTASSTIGNHRHWVSAMPVDDRNITGTGGGGQQHGVVADASAHNDEYTSGAGMNSNYGGTHAHTVDIAAFNSGTTGAHGHSFSVTSATAADHLHAIDITSASSGVSGAGLNIPAYREMIYCQKE